MSTQRRTFLKTWWSPYLGEWRPFHDNYIYASNTGCTFSGSAVYSPVPPTPSITPSPTLTQTPSNTPTLTPTTTTTLTASPTTTPNATSTSTPTSSLTPTPSVTETLTPTPSITQTNTPSATPTLTPTTTTTLTSTPNLTSTPTLTPSPTSSPAPFDPSSLGNLQYWFKATDGASVSSWTNNGLIGGSLTQPTAANQPQIVSNDTFGFGYTGQSVNFTSRDWMYLNHPSSATTFTGKTFFFVANVKDRANTGWAIGIQEASGYTSSNSIFDYQFYDGSLTTVSRSKPGKRQFTFTTGSTLFAGSGLTTTGYTAAVNDVVGTSGTTAYNGTNAVYIGFGYDSGSANVNDISVFEFLGYNKLLTQSEFDQVLNYLKTKYAYSLINPTPTPTATPTKTPQVTPTNTPSPTATSGASICSLYFDANSSSNFSAYTGTYTLSDDGTNQAKYLSALGAIVNCGQVSGTSWSLWYKISGSRTHLIGANDGNNVGRFTVMDLNPNNIPTCSYDYLGGNFSSDSILSGITRNGLIYPISGTSTTENGQSVTITFNLC